MPTPSEDTATDTALRRLRRRRCRKLGHLYGYTESLGPEWCERCGEREIVGPTTVTVITPEGWPKSQ